MSTAINQNNDNLAAKNLRIALVCFGLFLSMLALAYAAVPLYDLFCRVTGYGGTVQRTENVDGVSLGDRKIVVRFDAGTSASLNWKFAPQKREVEVQLGQKMIVNYVAENKSSQPIVGMATFNVTPQSVGSFFNKIECFCFTDTRLAPGEKLIMPVVFYVDPDLDKEEALKKLSEITLSYTFFESEDEKTDKIAAGQNNKNAGENSNENL